MEFLRRAVIPGLIIGIFLLPTATAWLDAVREISGQRFELRAPERGRVIVLGFDGVDPDIAREFLDRLPSLVRLSRDGTFCDCRTTEPPESPVAWATFTTGRNPGGTGIFDFVRRDPLSEDSYRPRNGMVERIPPLFGPFGFPVRPPRAVNLRGGEGFWEPVSRAGYEVSVLRMPLTFPPTLSRGGELLAGLGVPDLRGTNGSYTLFSAAQDVTPGDTIFGGRHVKIYPRGGEARAELDGPPDPRAPGSGRILKVPVRFTFGGGGATAQVGEAEPVHLSPDLYSRWVPVTFSAGPFVRLHGLVRFLLLESAPDPAVYASPIQLAPQAPPIPISSPTAFSRDLADRLGPRKTAGWPEDTFAANDRVLNDSQVFLDIRDNYRDDETLLLDRLDRSRAALIAMVFSAQDRVSHLFFRYRDPRHPAHKPEEIEAFRRRTGIEDPILESYLWMDATLAKVLARMRPEDTLLVVSDHGFHSWRQGFNLNTWLYSEGYLALADAGSQGRNRTLDQFFRTGAETSHIDWGHTKAYALGLGQIYLNLRGRESGGVVDPAEKDALIEEIRSKLLGWRAPDGTAVFTRVERAENLWRGERMGQAPEIQCMFADGFRVSWQTALLGVPQKILEDNDYPWSGDHCSNDASQTAGIFLSNRKVDPALKPGLEDIASTVCALLGVEPPSGAEGRALLR